MHTGHIIERSIIVLLAGSQAERMALGRAKSLGSGLDFYEAVRYAGYLCGTRAETSAIFGGCNCEFARWRHA
ncbi:MAG: hypothetical protein EHM55_04420 [Acidobacteria bacterium]|nr:MAG: hypothetical protein EHM55_04420 [Acidobacteriota bacterium]